MNKKPTAYCPRSGKENPKIFACFAKKLVRRLHQDAGAVAGARVRADRAAMFEIEENRQAVLDDLM